MKKTIILVGIILVAFAAWVMSQATVALFPNVQVTEQIRADAVWAVCYTSGYGVVDGVAVPGAWEDSAAMWTHYRIQLIKILKRKYEVAKYQESLVSVPPESSYDIGVPEE